MAYARSLKVWFAQVQWAFACSTVLFLPFALAGSQEGLILLGMKGNLKDPEDWLNNWNAKDDTPCNWTGITCGESSKLVEVIDLTAKNLSGPFPSAVCRLPHLRNLSLANNNIRGTLSPQLSMCSKLQHLDLSQNLLVGSLPEFISDLEELKYLDLSANNFSGSIPPGFGNLPNLQILNLCCNLLNETITPHLGNLSNLLQLGLAFNPFSPGPLPDELGNLTNLENLWLPQSNLVGEIPDSFGNLKALKNLDLSQNELSGIIPESITMLKQVAQIELFSNKLTGQIPRNMGNLTALRKFDASMNMLNGTIPEELAGLPLESLNLYNNSLVGNIPEAIGNSPNLMELKLFANHLTGNMPESLGRNSGLKMLDVSGNELSGTLPPDLCNQGRLQTLDLLDNKFMGNLPSRYGECLSLIRVRLRNNQFTGPIPTSFWGLPHVSLLDLTDNNFQGVISSEIGNANNLSQLLISGNQFSGSLPDEIGWLLNLSIIDASDNQLTGTLPSSLGRLRKLGELDLHGNQFSGDLPSDIRRLTALTDLNLSNNRFSGAIPAELGELPVLTFLDLSVNSFSGTIPPQLGNLKLNIFNVSDNQLTGPVPSGFSNSYYQLGLLGNPGLCSEDLGEMRSCSEQKGDRRRKNIRGAWLLPAIFGLAGIIFVLGLAWFYRQYRQYSRTKGRDLMRNKSSWMLTSFHRLGFRENEILDCIDEENVIGSGGSGKVYRATLGNGETVAVKRLWNTDRAEACNDNGFKAEVETLGKIRHKNIVKLWCCCANGDSNLLVYEYMPNGSLGDLLHGPKASVLDWPTRYKIAVGAAQGLSYLHHDCVPPIVHRDVKSNNILLDADFGARVADFGLAKILQSCDKGMDAMSAVAGSYGYIAPEYAYTLKVNEKSDIYSYGVVLLELVTGKQPVDPEFEDNKDLVKWACNRVEKKDGLQQVLDPRIADCFKEEMAMVLKVALLCTSALPINRPSMRRVLEMLHDINTHNRANELSKDAKFSL